jgi:phage terminase large subunit-like protein
MGLRGPGARAKGGRPKVAPSAGRPPWARPGLTRADRVIAFIESLRVTSGAHAGRKFLLRPWQKTIIRAWYRTGPDGRRVVRTGLLTMGRKNGKTSLCAAIALCHLVGPEVEPRGCVVAAARDSDQSGLLYAELVAFIQGTPRFEARTNIQRHSKVVEDLVSGSTFRALSSDAKKAHGQSPSVIILDELAQWGTGPGRELYTALTTSQGARKEPLTLVISTQTADEHSLMSQLVDYGKEVLAGRIADPTFSAHIFEVPMDADIWDESLWPLANPALDDFRSLAEMRVFAARAKQMPTDASVFRLYYLNQRVQAEERWLPLDQWDEGAVPVDRLALRGRRCYVGVDAASTQDLTAVVAVFPDDDGGVDVVADFFVPRDHLEARARHDHVPYDVWAREGWLVASEGNVQDFDLLERCIRDLAEREGFDVAGVALDPWNCAALIARLQLAGLPAFALAQTVTHLSAPSKLLERLVLGRKIRHGGHPVLRWNAGNAVVQVDHNENIRPSKAKSIERVDGLVALVNALHLVLAAPGASIYETRDVVAIDL